MSFNFDGMTKDECYSVYRKANAKRARAKNAREKNLNDKQRFLDYLDLMFDAAEKHDLMWEIRKEKNVYKFVWFNDELPCFDYIEVSREIAQSVNDGSIFQ